MSQKISFIISTNRALNESIFLAKNILDDNAIYNIEVVIVNQSSEFLRSVNHDARITVVNTNEKGLSRSRNLGIAKSSGEWIVVLDDDVRVATNFLESFFAVKRDPNFCYVSSVRISDKLFYNPRQNGKPRLLTKWSIDTALSVGLVLSSRLIDRVGGFDENLGLGCDCGSGEETDLLLRIIRVNMSVYYDPTLVIYHPKDHFGLIPSLIRSFNYGKGRGCIIKKSGKEQGGVWIIYNLFITPLLKLCYALVTLNVIRGVRYLFNLSGIIVGFTRW